MSATVAAPTFREIVEDGRLRWHLHPGQKQAWHATERFVVVLAGSQAGKTSFGPVWLLREIETQGPGDYLIATPSYPLLELKCLPEFKWSFDQTMDLGKYISSPTRKFTFTPEGAERLFGYKPNVPTVIYFGHAQDPDSLESGTFKAAWLDEAGQKRFRRDSWEAIQRRLSLNEGRVLVTTTPYALNWLKTEFYDRWERHDPDVAVINFASIDNPSFPRAEWDRMLNSLPAWKFNMFYRGRFTRPAGLIFDCFDDTAGGPHVIPTFTIPDDWARFHGSDFGGVNTAAIYLAAERNEQGPTGRYVAYREYHEGGRTAAEHAAAWKRGEPRTIRAIGGSKSEGQWRKEFGAAGFPVSEPPISDVEVGIDRLYAGIKEGKLLVMEHLSILREQLRTYSRVLDDRGEATVEIEDKSTFHILDSARYVCSWLFRPPNRGGLA